MKGTDHTYTSLNDGPLFFETYTTSASTRTVRYGTVRYGTVQVVLLLVDYSYRLSDVTYYEYGYLYEFAVRYCSAQIKVS